MKAYHFLNPNTDLDVSPYIYLRYRCNIKAALSDEGISFSKQKLTPRFDPNDLTWILVHLLKWHSLLKVLHFQNKNNLLGLILYI